MRNNQISLLWHVVFSMYGYDKRLSKSCEMRSKKKFQFLQLIYELTINKMNKKNAK